MSVSRTERALADAIKAFARPYSVELRLGYADPRVRRIAETVRYRFRLGHAFPRDPALTLVGPFGPQTGNGPGGIRDALERCAGAYDELSFAIGGWEERASERGRTLAFAVTPSDDLRRFRDCLARDLGQTSAVDPSEPGVNDSLFGIALATDLDEQTSRSVMEFVNGSTGGRATVRRRACPACVPFCPAPRAEGSGRFDRPSFPSRRSGSRSRAGGPSSPSPTWLGRSGSGDRTARARGSAPGPWRGQNSG
jgi:hypothetical protein